MPTYFWHGSCFALFSGAGGGGDPLDLGGGAGADEACGAKAESGGGAFAGIRSGRSCFKGYGFTVLHYSQMMPSRRAWAGASSCFTSGGQEYLQGFRVGLLLGYERCGYN